MPNFKHIAVKVGEVYAYQGGWEVLVEVAGDYAPFRFRFRRGLTGKCHMMSSGGLDRVSQNYPGQYKAARALGERVLPLGRP